MTVEAYPLHWPDNWPRTPLDNIGYSAFKTSMNDAQNGLMYEIDRLGGEYVVLSTNIRLRKDGMPYTSDKEPEDAGVAVYFQYRGEQMCFACDKYYYVKENMQAIRKTIEALRGIERWGASDMMQRAFSGFAQLPSPEQSRVRLWREVLGIAENINDIDYIKHVYKRLASERHPDKQGGSDDAMAELNKAWEQALLELGS
jgi:hypothetical protein